MKITDVEAIPIYPRIAERNHAFQARFNSINRRTIFKVHTDNGLVGYGDYRCPPPPQSEIEPLIGGDPFDQINNNLNAGICGALYDVMGKHLEVPAYRLMGQKVRDAVSVAAWTRPASPEAFRDEIARAADQGYMTFKMHTCEYHDVVEPDSRRGGGGAGRIQDPLRFQLKSQFGGGTSPRAGAGEAPHRFLH